MADQTILTPTEEYATKEGWRYTPLLQQSILLAIPIVFLYYGIWAHMVMDWWNDPNFSHGFFVPVFSGFVIWQDRRLLAELRVRPAWVGLGLMAAALAVLVVGVLGAEMFLSRSSFVFLLAGLVIYFLGWQHFRTILFPLGFLMFMIPIPMIIFNQIAFPLQFFAARLASSLLSLSGVPVLREGNVIQLPAMALEVAQACSGIRSLMSLGAVAVMYGYFLESRTSRRVVLALASVPVAVLANALRVMMTGLLVHYWDPEKAEGFFHTFSGWVIFVLSLGLLFSVHAAFNWFERLSNRTRERAN